MSRRSDSAACHRHGFTLMEIMIVVSIIGLLAAISIPAFKKIRNTAIEKTLYNDARQISSGATQYFTENAATSTTCDNLVGYGKYVANLSAGTMIASGPDAALVAANNLWTATTGLSGVTVATAGDPTNFKDAVITIGNVGYDTGFSSKAAIAAGGSGGYATGTNYLNFSVETGQALKKGVAATLNYQFTSTDYVN